MRGKDQGRSRPAGTHGITPAYAGKRSGFPAVEFYVEDHPRLCGEKLSVGLCSDKMTGSPPPMRGKVCIFSSPLVQHRITPAYAGKRVSVIFTRSSGRDHPRLCGEKIQKDRSFEIRLGSPPPMRGKAEFQLVFGDTVRITPAYAGKRVSDFLKK